jgi:cationic peptide transport system permease protein
MINFIYRRLILFISTMFVLTTIIYWIHVRLSTVDIIKLLPDYLNYTQQLLIGNFGVSTETGLPVLNEMKTHFPPTLELVFLALFISLFAGIPLGIICGLKHRSFFDKVIKFYSQISNSIPVFWLGQIFIIFFCITFKIFPTYGNINLLYDIPPITGYTAVDVILTDDPDIIKNMLLHFCLPVLTLTIMPLAEVISLSRVATIEMLHTNFVKAALCRGNSLFIISIRHILHNIIPILLPHLSILLCNLFSSCILVEVVFEWPGIGQWLTQSVTNADYPVLESTTFMLATCLLILNIATEIICTVFYPPKKRVNINV